MDWSWKGKTYTYMFRQTIFSDHKRTKLSRNLHGTPPPASMVPSWRFLNCLSQEFANGLFSCQSKSHTRAWLQQWNHDWKRSLALLLSDSNGGGKSCVWISSTLPRVSLVRILCYSSFGDIVGNRSRFHIVHARRRRYIGGQRQFPWNKYIFPNVRLH